MGLSGQMHGLTLLDADDAVIRPALIWCDQRSQEQVDWINAKAGQEMVLAQTANPVLTGFTAPKLLWVRDHDPASYERVRSMLLPKDYIRFRLTGEFASEVSDASGTALFDVVGRRWALPLTEKLGVDASILPRVVESTALTGSVSSAAADATGLAAGTPVVGGAGGPSRQRGGQWDCRARTGVLHDRDFGRCFRAPRPGRLRPCGAGAYVLPRRSGQVARDGSHAGGRLEPAVVPRPLGAGPCREGLAAGGRSLRPAHGRRRLVCRQAAKACSGCPI